jgi:hypothetical protein
MNSNSENWKTKTLIIGGILGVLAGLGAAYLLIQRAQVENQQPRFSAGEGVKLGISVLGVLRQVSDIGTPK